MDAPIIKRLRQRFEAMSSEDRHFAHRHLLDVMRQMGDAALTDNSDHIGSRIAPDEKLALRLLADERGTTTSALVRDAIRTYIQHSPFHPERTADDTDTRH